MWTSPQALSDFVSKIIGFDNLIVIVYHKNHTPHVLYREYKDPKVYLLMDSDYIKAAYLLDPFYQAAQEGLQSGIHQIFELAAVKTYSYLLTALCEQYWKNYVPEEGKNVALPPITDRLRNELKNQHEISLSPRQAEVALYILQGHSSLSISLNLNISKETVKVFRKQLYAKCNISSQAELFALLMPIFSVL